jgi:hypothetical protein
VFAALAAVQVAVLWGTYLVTGSNFVQGVVMVALAFAWRPFYTQAGKTRPSLRIQTQSRHRTRSNGYS